MNWRIRATEEKIHDLRARAQEESRKAISERQRIESDTLLSEEGKSQRIKELGDSTRATLREYQHREAQILKDEIASMERLIFGGTNITTEQVVSFRDAQARVRSITGPDAIEMYKEADLGGDEHMKRALARQAVRKGWPEVQEMHFGSSPENKEWLSTMRWADRALNEGGFQRAAAYMSGM